MKNAAKRLGLMAAVMALVVAGTTSVRADLVYSSGENTGFVPTTNDYGSTGAYYDRESGSLQFHSHPGGGPVAILAVINPDLTVTLYTDSKAGPYDNAEDTQIGVLNHSSAPLLNFHVSGPKNTFGFDGDGINHYTVSRTTRRTPPTAAMVVRWPITPASTPMPQAVP